MTEDPLQRMKQWFEQQETMHTRDAAGPGASKDKTRNQSQTDDINALIVRQSAELSRFSEQLLTQLEQTGSLSFETFDQIFLEHLEKLTQSWVIDQYSLPELFWIFGLNLRLNSNEPTPNPLLQLLENWSQLPEQPPLPKQWKKLLARLVSETREFEALLAAVLTDYLTLNRLSLKQFHQHLEARSTPIAEINDLHKLWCRCFENEHTQLLGQSDFQQRRAELINALTALQLLRREMNSEILELFDIPSMSQLTLLRDQLAQQKKQQRLQQRRQTQLEEEVAQLKLELQRFNRDRASES